MTNCNYKYKNTLNFLPSIQTKKDKQDLSKNLKSFPSAQPAKRGVRGYLTPLEKREFELEQEEVKKEIKKWEKMNNRKFATKCRKIEVESLTPSGFDRTLEAIMRHVMRAKPYPKRIIHSISKFLERKLDEETMEALDLDESDLELSIDFQEKVKCVRDEISKILDQSPFDEAPRDIYHMEYEGDPKPAWNETLKFQYRDMPLLDEEASQRDPAPKDTCDPGYEEPGKESQVATDKPADVFEASEADVPPFDEFHLGYAPVGKYSDIESKHDEESIADTAPIGSDLPGYELEGKYSDIESRHDAESIADPAPIGSDLPGYDLEGKYSDIESRHDAESIADPAPIGSDLPGYEPFGQYSDTELPYLGESVADTAPADIDHAGYDEMGRSSKKVVLGYDYDDVNVGPKRSTPDAQKVES